MGNSALGELHFLSLARGGGGGGGGFRFRYRTQPSVRTGSVPPRCGSARGDHGHLGFRFRIRMVVVCMKQTAAVCCPWHRQT